MGTTLSATDFNFPGQTDLYHGKVRDVYTINDSMIVSVATDRISAFDVILPRPIPYKGQVLNLLAKHFLDATGGVVANWLQAVPDPNVSIGIKAEPFKVEMVIRDCLVGHAWREYQAGKRSLCGQSLPEGLAEYDKLPEPIITPTTKAATGHDEDIAAEEIIARGLASQSEWEKLAAYTKELFKLGQTMAAERGLVLADTKYEFGKVAGNMILIDEVHTPDSSRYFYAEGYQAYLASDRTTVQPPKHLSKEFVRTWLLEHGFSGQTGQSPPDMPDDFVQAVSDRYIELFEKMTGRPLEPADGDPLPRIEGAVNAYFTKGNL